MSMLRTKLGGSEVFPDLPTVHSTNDEAPLCTRLCFSLGVLSLKLARTQLLSHPWPWPETLRPQTGRQGSLPQPVPVWGPGRPLVLLHPMHPETPSATWTRVQRQSMDLPAAGGRLKSFPWAAHGATSEHDNAFRQHTKRWLTLPVATGTQSQPSKSLQFSC